MPVLENWRYELFARSVARGDNLSKAYVGAGYSENGAAGNANKLLKDERIAARIDELIRDGIDGQPGIGDIGLAQLLAQDNDVLQGLNFSAVSLEWLQKEVFRNMQLARTANNFAASNKALEMMLEIKQLQDSGVDQKTAKRGRGRPRVDKDPNKEGGGNAPQSRPEIQLSIINKFVEQLGNVPRNQPDPADTAITVTAVEGDIVAAVRDERNGSTVLSVDGTEGTTGGGVPVPVGTRRSE
jgi:hypothetical protein